MYNWSVDEKTFKRVNPEGYMLWKITQQINYNEPGEKLNKRLVLKHWKEIRDRLDPDYREFLEFLLWPRRKKASQKL